VSFDRILDIHSDRFSLLQIPNIHSMKRFLEIQVTGFDVSEAMLIRIFLKKTFTKSVSK